MSHPSSDRVHALLELAKAFAAAEYRLKATELHTSSVSTAVINELRYAACHLLRAESPEPNIIDITESDETQHHDTLLGETEFFREVRRAIDHCRRAHYDAVEFDAATALKRLSLFLGDYRLIISDDIDGMTDALTAARKAQEQIQQGKDAGTHRGDYLDSLDSTCGPLLEACTRLEALRPVLNAKVERKQQENEDKARKEAAQQLQKRKDYQQRWLVCAVAAIIAIPAAIVALKLLHSPPPQTVTTDPCTTTSALRSIPSTSSPH